MKRVFVGIGQGATPKRLLMTFNTIEDYRPGAAGSLVDEYERALFQLKSVLEKVSEANYVEIADAETDNEDCRSIETIMNHVVRSGYFYSKYIRDTISMDSFEVKNRKIAPERIASEIDQMFANTLEIFDGNWDEMDRQMITVYIDTGWGVRYNIDQMLEHAIVHVLRHRRQIEKFLLILQN